MAVSNAIGSNVFDILVCLGLPWFMRTAMVHPGSVVRVKSFHCFTENTLGEEEEEEAKTGERRR